MRTNLRDLVADEDLAHEVAALIRLRKVGIRIDACLYDLALISELMPGDSLRRPNSKPPSAPLTLAAEHSRLVRVPQAKPRRR